MTDTNETGDRPFLTTKLEIPRADSYVWGILAVSVGIFLRFYRLGSQSVWWDEVALYLIARLPFPQALTRIDINGPIVPFVVRWTMRFIGVNPVGLRFSSALFGAATVSINYVAVRRLFGGRAAFWTTLLLAVLPFHVSYSQETRPYSLAALLGLLSILAWDRAMDTDRWRDWLWFAAVTALGVYTHYLFVSLVFGQALWLALNCRRFRTLGMRGWAAFGLAFLLFAPWLPMVRHQQQTTPFALGKISWWHVQVTIEAFSGTYGNFVENLARRQCWEAALLWAGLIGFGIRAGAEKYRSTRIFIGAFLSPLICGFAIAFLTHAYLPRYVIMVLPASYFLIAPAFEASSAVIRRISMVMALLLAAISVSTLRTYYTTEPKGPWARLDECTTRTIRPYLNTVIIWQGMRPVTFPFFRELTVLNDVSDITPDVDVAILAGPTAIVQNAAATLSGWEPVDHCSYGGIDTMSFERDWRGRAPPSRKSPKDHPGWRCTLSPFGLNPPMM